MLAPAPHRRRRLRTSVVLVAVLAGSTLLPGRAAEAETARPTAAAPTVSLRLSPASPDLPGLPETSRALAEVPVSSGELSQAASQYAEVDGEHSAARGARLDVEHARTARRADVAALEATVASGQARVAGLSSRLEVLEGALQELAVESFVAGDDDARMDSALASETPAIGEADRKEVYGNLSMQVLLAERAAYLEQIRAATDRADAATRDLGSARAEVVELTGQREGRVATEVEAGQRVADARVGYEDARVLSTVDGVEFPLVALDAYYRASASAHELAPTCGVQWWGLAGISRVEGHHGSYGGTQLQANGDTSRPIIGIQLNGDRSTAVIGDSDGGALDGDASFDRAVGPMQFIPQTWRRFEADGNGDGVLSPFNLYDATLAAARYLCRSSHGLDQDAGLRTAYFSYNHSLLYVDTVLRYARQYETSLDLPPLLA